MRDTVRGTRTRSRTSTAGLLAALGLGVTGLVVPVAAAPPATAATGGFYTPPSPLPSAAPGTVIRSRPLSLGAAGSAAPSYRGRTVMYHSRDAHGRDIAVTGAVLTPTAAWSGTGPRPYVSFGVGTQGLGHQCAPTKQIAAGTEYETPNLVAALQQGYGVAVTDYEGYVNGRTPTYVAGRSEAHTVLDAVRAARHLPGADATRRTPVGLWGYSQGGGATAWAAALAPSYAPDVRLVGAATGGVPADLKAVGANLNGGPSGGLLGESLVGLATAYPRWADFDALSNRQGRQTAARIKTECVGDNIANHPFLDVKDLTKDHLTYPQFTALPGEARILATNNLGRAAPAPKVPVLQYHSSNDEIVPLPQARALHQTWCARGVTTSMVLYPGEHLTGDTAGAPGALAFLAARFGGQPFVSSCPL
jgi:pimeloyl-ACP methyl ester carboxylesterase